VDDGAHAWKSSWNRGDPRVTFYLTKEKPWDFAFIGEPFACEHYRGDAKGRCLILGYAPTVWTDLEAVLPSGKFDAVIASPEAAEHWPAEVTAIASDDNHADVLARMMGYNDVVWCGRSGRRAA